MSGTIKSNGMKRACDGLLFLHKVEAGVPYACPPGVKFLKSEKVFGGRSGKAQFHEAG